MIVHHLSPDLRERTCILESDRLYPDRCRLTSCHVHFPRYTRLYLNLSIQPMTVYCQTDTGMVVYINL
jgi:hypothetical protein